jgi:hypothetical protein
MPFYLVKRLCNVRAWADRESPGTGEMCYTISTAIASQPRWKEVVVLEQDSGNGTIRIIFSDSESPEAQHILDELVSVGCMYERASSELVAVTVPPNLDIPFSQLANYLNSADDEILVGWEVGKNLTRMQHKV